jgi:uncharacterized membrane protein YbaN (DUF454 family)
MGKLAHEQYRRSAKPVSHRFARRQLADRLSWPGFVNQPVVTMTYKPPGSRLSRFLFGILAYVSLGIGIAAIFIPGLPTTEFILLAAWAATRSSPRLNAWLEHHRVFGPILYNWRNGRLVARRAKISATVSMLVCAIVMLGLLDHAWWLYLAIAGMALGNLWIWSRPEPVRELS